ncbi:hypothetical protein C0J52_04640 [Blattella germanica]|nr:hypothetical protein C0J52_04640 [Blattella germanica]
MSWDTALFLVLASVLCASAHHHHQEAASSSYGHPLTDRDALLNETRRVHPYFNPRDRERPLITTCCDLSLNKSSSHTSPPAWVKEKCQLEVIAQFETESPESSSEEDLGLDVMNRNMTVSTEDGIMIYDNVLKASVSNGKSQMGVTDRMVERCVVRANIIGPAMSQHKGYACNFAPVEFEQCILERVDLLCPEYNQIRADLCDRYREKLRRKYTI